MEHSNPTDERKRVHQDRVKAMKLRECVKTLASVGITVDELREYLDKFGFNNLEQERKAKLQSYRKTKESDRKRVLTLAKAREAKQANNKIKTVHGNKEVIDL